MCCISNSLIFLAVVAVCCSCTQFVGFGLGLLVSLMFCLKCARIISLVTHLSGILFNKLTYTISDFYFMLLIFKLATVVKLSPHIGACCR
jgi:hypothetical protein